MFGEDSFLINKHFKILSDRFCFRLELTDTPLFGDQPFILSDRSPSIRSDSKRPGSNRPGSGNRPMSGNRPTSTGHVRSNSARGLSSRQNSARSKNTQG